MMYKIEIENEEELQPLILNIAHGLIYQFTFLKPKAKEVVLSICKREDKLCIKIADSEEPFELELRVTYHSVIKESTHRVLI